MILTRPGNKRRIAEKIIPYFPYHTTFIDLFFGGGGLFFSKPRAKFNYCNDIENDIFNLFQVLKDKKDLLIKEIELMPIHQTLFDYWKNNGEQNDIMKAVRFLFLSNFSYLGKQDTLHIKNENPKQMILDKIQDTFKYIRDVYFLSCDFREVLSKISWGSLDPSNVFIYADPPYLNTCDKTYSYKWQTKDSEDLFEVLTKSGFKFALSEFDSSEILNLSDKYNLFVVNLGGRVNIKNKRNEILITNYQNEQTLF